MNSRFLCGTVSKQFRSRIICKSLGYLILTESRGLFMSRRFLNTSMSIYFRSGLIIFSIALFHVYTEFGVDSRSEITIFIISTNLEFSEWTQLFENEMILAVLIDRVTFRSFVLNMNCSSSYCIDSTINNSLWLIIFYQNWLIFY